MRLIPLLILALTLVSPLVPTRLASQEPVKVVVEGTLVSDITGEPVRGAEINLSGIDLHVYSDSVGHFRLVAVAPGSYWLSITAEGFLAAEGEFVVDRAGAFTIRLQPLEGAKLAERGMVRGIVRDLESGMPLESAQLYFPALSRTTLTDASGEFSFPDLPPGRLLMRTEHLGYQSRSDTLTLPPGHVVTVEVELSIAPIELDPITVVGEPRLLSLDLSGFYDRRNATSGVFLTREEILERRPLLTTDLFKSLPGARVLEGLEPAVYLRAGLRPSLQGPDGLCGPTVYLDGILFERGGRGSKSSFLNRIAQPDQIAGLEVFSSSATTPLQYNGQGSDCGVILIWTR